MEDERGGGASVIEAAQKLGLAAVTIDAVDRSGRLPNGQLVPNIPAVSMSSRRPLAAMWVSTTIRLRSTPAMSGMTFSASRRRANGGLTRSRTRSRRDGATTRSPAACAPRRPRWFKKLEQGGKLADEAANAGLKVETAAGFRRDAALPGVPAAAVTAAFRTAKDGVGQAAGAGTNEWIVFRVTDVSVPPVDLASDEMKKLKETLQRGLTMNWSRNTSRSWKLTSAHQLIRPSSRKSPVPTIIERIGNEVRPLWKDPQSLRNGFAAFAGGAASWPRLEG